jgi:S1-C subfamily serine protease
VRDPVSVKRVLGLAALLVLVGCGSDARTAPLSEAVVRVEIETCRPGPVGRATAVAVSTYAMVTVAHGFEGARSFLVRGSDGAARPAQLVHLDAERDVAVLRLSEPVSAPLPLGVAVDAGAAVMISAGDPAAFRVEDVWVRRQARVRLDGGVRRQAIELDADIEPGDSGAPIVVDDEVVAMVFASSRRAARGWALDVSELRAALEAADVSAPVVLECP